MLDANDPKAKQTHIPEGESFAEYLARRAGGQPQSADSTVATTGRAAVTYGRNGYDPKKRDSLESSYSARPATSNEAPSPAFVASPAPVSAGAGRKAIDYGKPGYSPQSRPTPPAPEVSSSSSAVEAPTEARPSASRVTYKTGAGYTPKSRGALERAFSAPAVPHPDADAAVAPRTGGVDYTQPYGGYDPKNRPSETQGKLARVFAAAAAFVSTLSAVEAAPALSATLGSKIDYKVYSPHPPTPNPTLQPPIPIHQFLIPKTSNPNPKLEL